jgi:limonene-1,2-epoxide hydrolase
MTPEEKLELARRSYDALSDLDPDAFIRFHAPDCEGRMTPSVAAVFGERFVGHDGLRSLVQEFIENTSSFKIGILEARIDADGMLLIKQRLAVTTAVMGAEVSLDAWQEMKFRDDLILSFTNFEEPPPGWGKAEALAGRKLEE